MALWTGPQVLVARRVRPGAWGAFPDLVPLAAAAHVLLPFDQLVADAGYGSGPTTASAGSSSASTA